MNKLEDFLRPTQEQLFWRLSKRFKGQTLISRGNFVLVKGVAPVSFYFERRQKIMKLDIIKVALKARVVSLNLKPKDRHIVFEAPVITKPENLVAQISVNSGDKVKSTASNELFRTPMEKNKAPTDKTARKPATGKIKETVDIFVEDIAHAVDSVKSNQKVRHDFMTFHMALLEERLEGEQRSLAHLKMLHKGKSFAEVHEFTNLSISRLEQLANFHPAH